MNQLRQVLCDTKELIEKNTVLDSTQYTYLYLIQSIIYTQ